MDHVGSAVLQQPAGEAPLLLGHLPAPVPAPVEGDDDPVPLPPRPPDPAAQSPGGGLRRLRQIAHAGSIPGGGPLSGNARRRRGQGEDEDAAPTGTNGYGGRRPGFVQVRSRARRVHPGGPERLQRLAQARPPPVQRVVVGDDRHVDSGGHQAADVPRVGPVVDALSGPRLLAGGDGRLQVHDPDVRVGPLQLLQGPAPGVGEGDRVRDRPVLPLRQLHVASGVFHVRLVQGGGHRLRKDLIEAPSDHHVARQEERHAARGVSVVPLCGCFRSRARSVHGGSPDARRRPPPTPVAEALPTEPERSATLSYEPWKT